ncbi:MAG: protein kinase domain-containing protein [Polyangiaceae bacterium]
MQGKDKLEDASGSVEVDSFLRDVARAPRLHPSAGAPAEPDLVGRTFLHFHVVERLGAGGRGVVYKAIDEKLRRPVALKVLSARLLSDSRHRETLLREARSAAAVNHPNIASIYEVHEGSEGAFFVMELVEGETLRTRLARTGPLPVTEALRVALEIARGLARAHGSSVVHRDLKCENVMLTRDGHVKLLDFGLATVEGEPEPDGGDAPSGGSSEPRPALGLAPTMPATPTPTTGGRIAGTPASMAPEQARGDAVDARADVYGFGVVLYEMLSGQAPFAHRGGKPWEWGDGSSPAWAPRRRLREVAPKVPRDIEDLVRRCTSYAKEQRPLDGAALVPLLEACARPRPRRWPFVAVGITVAALASSIAWAEWRRREHGEHPAAGAPLASTLPVAPKPTLRRVAYDEGVGAGSLSSDGTKMAYTTFFDAARPRPKTFRVRNLETRADEWFPVPGDAGVAWASFAGEGSAERLLVETAGPERALYVIRPDTKEATRVAPSLVPPSGATMSADGRFVLWLRYDAEQKTGQYMLREMATGVTRELGAVTELTTEFEISPTGALVGWLDHQGAAARLRVAHRDAPSQAKSIVLDPSLEYHAFTWIDDDRLALLTKDSLVSLRLDSSTLERRGSLEPIVRLSGLEVYGLKVHRALRAISLATNETRSRVMVGRLEPSRRVVDVHPLSSSDSDDAPATWASDGRTLLFTSDRSGEGEIYAQDVAGESPERLLTLGPAGNGAPQLAPGRDAVLYWRVAGDGPASLLRAPFDGKTFGAASVLFAAPDLALPLASNMRMRCPANGPACVVLWHASTEDAAWYRLDPRDGTRAPIEGLPVALSKTRVTSRIWDVSPDGREIAIPTYRSIDFFGLDGTARKLRSVPITIDAPDGLQRGNSLWALAYDADGKGVFLGNGPGRVDYVWADGRQTTVFKGGAEEAVGNQDFMVSADGTRAAFRELRGRNPVWIVDNAL